MMTGHQSRVFLFLCLCAFSGSFLFFISMCDFKIASLNLNGAGDIRKRMELYELMKLKCIDVMFVQETHSNEFNEAAWRSEWGGEVILSSLSSVSGGVGVLLSRGFLPISYELEEVVKGRLMVVTAKFECLTFIFVNVYAPNVGPERVQFLKIVSDVLSRCGDSDAFLYLGGDFNCCENDYLDRNHIEPHVASQRALIDLIKTHDLVDVWRRLHNNVKQYSWAQARGNCLSLARLDRFYCFKHHFNVFKMSAISPVHFSDHSLVTCKVFIAEVKKKSAYWHFNTNLLSDDNFKDAFGFFWDVHRTEKYMYDSLKLWWDCGKIKIKQFCQQYTLNIMRDITNSMRTLEIEIVELQGLLETTGDSGHFEALSSKRSLLADLLGTRAQGALVRSRFQSISQMDAPSKFFFGLEKKNGQSRYIHTLRAGDGTELTEPNEIRRRAVQFYSELYRSEYVENDELFDCFCDGLPKISSVDHLELKAPLVGEELHAALQGMDGGKSPGIDGLPVEFYKTLWHGLGQDLLEVFNESFRDLTLPLSCRRAVITLLPKKGDLTDIKNWRPVSLLCTDYKILSKALANRLKYVMDEVLHVSQTYCVPGRSIIDNVSLVRDVLEVSGSSGTDFGLISLDQEKAFDRVEHMYLWKVLEVFGLDPSFIAMFKVLYCDIQSVLKINGGLSAPFSVYRGVRQGCAMSGMLYALSIEPFLHRMRTCIEGLVLPGFNTAHVLSAYADDVMIFVRNQSDINIVNGIVNDFACVSCAKVNWGKSEALAVGKWSGGLPKLPGGLGWKRDGIKYLGVYLGSEEVVNKNWEGLLEKMTGRLKKWKWLLSQMSFRGRVLIINNLVASALWHRFACMEPPAGLIPKLQAALVDFFWDRMHWVPQSVLFLPKEEGGQGLIHLASRLATFRFQFVQKYLTGLCPVWKEFASIILRKTDNLGLDSALFLMDCKCLNVSSLPAFYKGVFKAWGLFKKMRLERSVSLYWLLQEPLIGGSIMDIQDNGLPGLHHILRSAGVLTLRQVVDVAGRGLMNTAALAAQIGLRSVRYARAMLNGWTERLTDADNELLRLYWEEEETPDEGDPFPDLGMLMNLEDCSGVLLDVKRGNVCELHTVNGKKIYECCVKVLNRSKLNGRTDTVWRQKCHVDNSVKPAWRVFYKSPLRKRSGDLQWRILHSAIAVNAFVSVINDAVSNACPFCGLVETIFHCFLECRRLLDLFVLLERLFISFGVEWSEQAFIFGAGYKRNNAVKWQLLNFIVGEAKLSIYLTRRNKMEAKLCDDIVPVFISLVKARVFIDFRFHRLMNSLKLFEYEWCYNDVICSVMEDKLVFGFGFA